MIPPDREIAELRARLAEAEASLAALAALREGGADALVTVAGVLGLTGAEKPYQAFFETMNEGGLTLDVEGRVLHCNPRFSAMLGLPVKALRGCRFLDYLAPEAAARIDGLLSSDGGGSCEATLLAQDGTRLPVRVSLKPMNQEAQRMLCLVVTDLSAHFQAEAALRRAAIVFDNSQEGILVSDGDNRILDVNPAFCRITGYQRDDVLGQDPKVLKSGQHDAAFYRRMWQSLIENNAWRGEIWNRRKNGELLPEFLSLNVVKNAAGEISHYVAIFSDMTERKQTEETLRQLNEELTERIERIESEVAKNQMHERMLIQQSRQAAMGEMISNIAHQWRQPLNTVGLVVQNIHEDYRENMLSKKALEEYVATALESVKHMSRTIDDFRDFFRPNKEKQRFLICDSVAEAIKLVGPSFTHNNIEISQDTKCEACATYTYGFPNEFAQVVLNILSNAKDAIIARKIAGKVHLTITKESRMITIAIRNNGGNIPEEILGKVFDPYFTTKENGTGIGLYMSRMILEKMDCHIAVRNVDNEVEVLIRLPLVQ